MNTQYWLLAACLAASLPVHASSFKPIEVKDSELSTLRGKYVMPGRIISFGVVMSSTWTNASGDTIGASANLQVQQNTVQPQFYVTTINQRGNSAGKNDNLNINGTGSVTGGAGLSTTQGVTQVVRAAGDNNSAYNNVGINVQESGQAPATSANIGQALAAGSTITSSNGAGSMSISNSATGGVQLAIQANNGQGSSLQQLGQGGLMQNTTLLGGANQVNNMTQLNVVLRDNLPSAGALDCNLTQLKGLRAMGY
ncbi:MAG: hypothetical protein PW845_14535 [Pseudomonas sp.]|nr:hypothetical protein [Pseudomonas sp.]